MSHLGGKAPVRRRVREGGQGGFTPPVRLKDQFAPLRPVRYGVGMQVVPAWKGDLRRDYGKFSEKKGKAIKFAAQL